MTFFGIHDFFGFNGFTIVKVTAHAEKENKPIIKGKRYNILRNSENLKPEQRETLQELLDLNTNIHNASI